MKKFLFMSVVSMCMLFVHAEDINLKLQRNATSNTGKRSPVRIPSANIDGRVLTFEASCIGCPLTLIQDGEIKYATIIVPNDNMDVEVILPDELCGVYVINIEFGSIMLVGEIEL